MFETDFIRDILEQRVDHNELRPEDRGAYYVMAEDGTMIITRVSEAYADKLVDQMMDDGEERGIERGYILGWIN